MLDLTNLSWPEAPFGADQRPFGRSSHMIAAFALDWDDDSSGGLLGVATAYLRFQPARKVTISPPTLSIGVRATHIEERSEAGELLALFDRALVRARRHAALLAGDDLGRDLERIMASGLDIGPGVRTVSDAWRDRETKSRGLARMMDTRADRDQPTPTGDIPDDPPSRRLLGRCIATALAAGWSRGHLDWDDTFSVGRVVEQEAWDLVAPNGATH